MKFPIARFLFAGAIAAVLVPSCVAEPRTEHDDDSDVAEREERMRESNGETEALEARREWMRMQRAFPLAEVAPLAVEQAADAWRTLEIEVRDDKRRKGKPGPPPDPKTLPWKAVGPAPIDTSKSTMETPNMGPTAGRASAIVIDPTNPSTIYAGFAIGGVWKSTDAGKTWKPTMDDQPTLAIGALALDPANPNTIYAGTGEPAFYEGFYGQGIFRSTDGGTTWSKYGSANFDGAVISRIVIDGNDLYVTGTFGEAGRGEGCTNAYTKTKARGLFKSSDGAKTFQLLKSGDMVDLEIDTGVMPRHMLVTDAFVGGFISVDGGATWNPVTGIPASNYARVEFAMAPSDHNVVYAGASDGMASSVYVSIDGGASFTPVANAPDYCATQCYWDNAVIVDPTDSSRVYVGGSLCGIWGSGDALSPAATWTALSSFKQDCGANFANWAFGYVHPDVHNFAIDPSDPATLYAATDGGLVRTHDKGQTWERLSAGIGTIQFYGICIDPVDPNVMYGGAQDNGSYERKKDAPTWTGIVSGDGGPCAVDSVNPKNVLLTSDGGAIFQTTTGFSPLNFTTVFNADPYSCAKSDPGCGDTSAFIPPLAGGAPSNFYAGTTRVWHNDMGGAKKAWKPISGDLTNGKTGCIGGGSVKDVITALAASKADNQTVYAGTGAGKLSVTQDGGATWKTISTGPLPGRWVSSIGVDAANAKIVYVAFSGFNAATAGKPGHIFKSTNAGDSWTPADIPSDIPVDSIVVHPVASDIVYAGTDFGVMVTNDGGTTWSVLGDGLPHSAVFGLAFQQKNARLVAGTHGRSAWALDFPPGTLGAMPASLSFSLTAGDADPAAQAVTALDSETYGSSIEFTVAADSPWITGFSATGVTAGPKGIALSVGVTSAGLAAGEYDGNLTLTPTNTSGGAAVSVPVHLSIKAKPADQPPPAADDSGCGCEVPGGSRPSWAPLGLLALAGLLARARRR